MTVFNGSLPTTWLMVQGIDPLSLAFLCASVAGLLTIALLVGFRQKRPRLAQLVPLIIASSGMVIDFPLFMALVLQHVISAHSTVFIGLPPLMAALFDVLRGGECPRRTFQILSLLGSLLVMGFILMQSTATSFSGDLLILTAVIACSPGYAERAELTRELGGWQVICRALVIALPLALPVSLMVQPTSWYAISTSSWVALSYVSLFSILAGFIFWYKELIAGGITAVGQLQSLQPSLGLDLLATLLHETVSSSVLTVTLGVVPCMVDLHKFGRQRASARNGSRD